MKFITPAALVCAGFALNGPLLAQDTPEKKAAQPPKTNEAAPPAPKSDPPAPETQAKPEVSPERMKNLTSYGFGFRNGRNFASQTGRYGLQMSDIDREQFLRGLFDALELKDSAFDQKEINDALTQLSAAIKERETKVAEKNKADGEKFLAENKKREGIITTESGLQYEVLKEGDGEVYTPPPAGERPRKQFMTIYRGTLLDGTEFDSSKGKPAPMSLSVIPGFKEALTTMPVGSKWKLYIPADLAYRESRRSAILGPNSALIFEVELTSMRDLPAPPTGGPRPVSPAIRRPGAGTGSKAVSPAVRVPTNPNGKARAVSPPVEIPLKRPPNKPGAPKSTVPPKK